jgi:hypothetical protein
MILTTWCSTATAAEIIFTIDPSESSFAQTGAAGAPLGGGAWLEQFPGSLSAPLSGHFLVEFDPSTTPESPTPATLRFIGGHGYYEVASTHVLSPGPGGFGAAAPGNLGGRAPNIPFNWAIRDLVWDFSSANIAGAGGVFPANQTSFYVLTGGIEYDGGSASYAGSTGFMTGGTWTLSESPQGSGDWTLTNSSYYDYGDETATFTAISTVVSRAHYGAANVAAVAPTETQAEALGGADEVGGVSASFSQETGGGTFSVQQVASETALSQAAVAAAETNPTFALSTDTLSANPQIWNVDFSGDLNGASVTLTFHYDPTLLPVGLDELTLGIWHFNSNTNEWDFGGTVDPDADTIAYTTDNFSPFQLGVNVVPEPSTLLLLSVGLLGLVGLARRRRKSA